MISNWKRKEEEAKEGGEGRRRLGMKCRKKANEERTFHHHGKEDEEVPSRGGRSQVEMEAGEGGITAAIMTSANTYHQNRKVIKFGAINGPR